MTQEEKQLLFIDLCARLPYNLYIRVEEFSVPENDDRITEGFIGNYLKDNRCNDYDMEGILNELADGLIDVKPYLRLMSSMTEDEEREFEETLQYTQHTLETYDWLNKKMFDYRGLIEKGLALKAKEGMYEF